MERHRDDDRTGQPGPITRRLDSEFAGKDGTTLLEGSRTEEEHPGQHRKHELRKTKS